MSTVSINPPKTPVTEGSNGVAAASVPNVCKMPGPPAPFVPTPLPNIGKSGTSPKGFSKKVFIEGKAVAIRGATFGSMGDIASKATGGGLISANTHGPTAFVAPGSMDVTIEGKAVHLLGDATTNNNGSLPNASALATLQASGVPPVPPNAFVVKCNEGAPVDSDVKFTPCEKQQICAKCAEINKLVKAKPDKVKRDNKRLTPEQIEDRRNAGNNAARTFKARQGNRLRGKGPRGRKLKRPIPPQKLEKNFAHKCAHEKWMAEGANPNMPGLSADHVHEIQLGGSPTSARNLKMMSSKANGWMGRTLQDFDPDVHPCLAPDCCG